MFLQIFWADLKGEMLKQKGVGGIYLESKIL